MAYTLGRCTNVDYCSLASAKRDIEVPIGEEFVCPECARPLRTPPTREPSGGLNLAVAGGVAALVLICGGVYAGYRLSRGQAPAAVAPAAVAPAAVAPAAPKPAQATPAAPPAAQPAPARPLAPATPEQAMLLRLNGTATLGATAAPRLAAAYLATLGDTDVRMQPGRAGETLVSGQRLGRPETISITIQPGEPGDEAGLAALGAGTADLAMTDRRIGRPELDRLRGMGDLSAPASEHAVGLEGEAVIVNPRNPVSALSLPQLRAILGGTLPSWQRLGATGPIHVIAEAGEPDAAGLPEAAAGLRRVRGAASAVLDDPQAIAVVPLSHVGRVKVLAIAALGAAPAMPVPADIANGSYPLARRLYLYAPAGGSNPFPARFAAFAVSPEGQAAIAQAGLVPLSVAPTAPVAPLTPKERYRKLVTGATRLTADLHFEPNSNKLDLHSSREVDRVWNSMMSDHTPSDHLILIGFADNQGTPEKNLSLSQQRAKAVAEVFARRGLPPGQVVAFGSDLPVADNAAEEGRQRNRRVEVFLRP